MSEMKLEDIVKEIEILVDKSKEGKAIGSIRSNYGQPCGNEGNNPCDERCKHADCDSDGFNYCTRNNQGCHVLLSGNSR